jgi:hypothetical protein
MLLSPPPDYPSVEWGKGNLRFMSTEEGLRLVSTLISGGFIAYAAIGAFRGSLYDVDEGLLTR